MKRLVTGWRLARGSLRVVLAVPSLVLPGMVHALAVLGLCWLAFGAGGPPQDPVGAARLFAALLASSAVGTVAAGVVVAVVGDRLEGGSAGLGDGLRLVRPRVPALLGWAVLNATVGLVLRLVEERLGPVGRWVTGSLGVVFSAATLLVVPVVVHERKGPTQGVRRSAALFRQRWGEVVVGDAGLGLVLALLALPVFLVVGGALAPAGLDAAVVGVVVVLAAYLSIAMTANAVLSAALHRFATTGDAGAFGDLAPLFAPRRRAYSPSYAAPHGQWDAS